MKLFSSPLVPPVLAFVFGLGAGLGFFWFEASTLLKAARAARAAAVAEERPAKPWDFWTLEIENLASELKDRNAAVVAREQALKIREERLAADQEALKQTRQQIEALRTEISGKMTELGENEIKNLKTLSKTYSAITPKAVVNILREMDESTVVKILSQMKSDVVSPILEEMGNAPDPAMVKLAARLSDKLRLVKQPAVVAAP